MPAAGMPTLRTSRSVGQPILWWRRGSKPGPAPEPERGTPSTVMQVLKQRFARKVLEEWRARNQNRPARLWEEEFGEGHVWQRRFYDFALWTKDKRVEKLRYIHRNPVKRGLVLEPEQWEWSSYRHYALGEKGRVLINEAQMAPMRVSSVVGRDTKVAG